jgi:hypothetical protein
MVVFLCNKLCSKTKLARLNNCYILYFWKCVAAKHVRFSNLKSYNSRFKTTFKSKRKVLNPPHLAFDDQLEGLANFLIVSVVFLTIGE